MKGIIAFALVFLLLFQAEAQTPTEIKDMTANSNSWLSNSIHIGNRWFYGINDRQLWVSDGSPGGTYMLRQFSSGSQIAAFHEHNDKLIFLADSDGDGNYELWSSDGTGGGTVQVKDLDAASYNGANWLQIGNLWYFSTDDRKLWRTDGVSGGTIMLRQFSAGTTIGYFHEQSSKLLLLANADGVNGWELWSSDGTGGGTVEVKDVSATSSNAANWLKIGNVWYFSVNDRQLWRTDGVTGGTYMLRQFSSGTTVGYFHEQNSKLLFLADSDGLSGWELWTSDGSGGGTVEVKDLSATSVNGANWLKIGSIWYFSVNGRQLWRTDGQTAGTIMLRQFAASTVIQDFHELNGALLLFGDSDSNNGWELWTSDGTGGGTVQVKDIAASTGSTASYWREINDKLYFTINNRQLWITDGSSGGTFQLRQFSASTYVRSLLELNGKLLFLGDADGTNGLELWISDGTGGGTVEVKAISATDYASMNWARIGPQWHFSHKNAYWYTDGTTAGTANTKNFPANNIRTFHQINTQLLFFADNDPDSKFELWGLQGSTAIVPVSTTNMEIFPQPGTDRVQVRMESVPMERLELFDLKGQLLFTLTPRAAQAEMDLSEVPAGMYILRIHTENEVISKRIVRQ